jgi:hypothetical protein
MYNKPLFDDQRINTRQRDHERKQTQKQKVDKGAAGKKRSDLDYLMEKKESMGILPVSLLSSYLLK